MKNYAVVTLFSLATLCVTGQTDNIREAEFIKNELKRKSIYSSQSKSQNRIENNMDLPKPTPQLKAYSVEAGYKSRGYKLENKKAKKVEPQLSRMAMYEDDKRLEKKNEKK